MCHKCTDSQTEQPFVEMVLQTDPHREFLL
jgi:hypothetical protein